MKIAILGYSTLEQSEAIDAYKFFRANGDDITIYYWEGETKAADLPADVTAVRTEDDKKFPDLDNFDLIIRTASIHPKYIQSSKPVTTIYNEFMSRCPCPMIGVTGTKGKGTTSTLIAKILEAAGHKVFLAGNIGIPPLSLLPRITPDSLVVLELSSFQLMDIQHSPHIGVCLMVVPEHLNWHTDLDEYKRAKSAMFAFQTPQDLAIYNMCSPNSIEITNSTKAKKIGYAVPDKDTSPPSDAVAYVANDTIYFGNTEICKTDQVALLGRHNLENICAAITATWELIGGNISAIVSVITSFSGLEHRLEFVREVKGAKYYDDSFATTPETAIAAIESFQQPLLLIVGGSDKGIPFDSLADTIASHKPKAIFAIGQTGPKIAELLRARGVNNVMTEGLSDMPSIVAHAHAMAESGDVVLLSTGCASFGMFKDYKDRGNQFKSAVHAL